MPNGSYSTGPGWGDVINRREIEKIVESKLQPLHTRITVLENKYKMLLLILTKREEE